jgi:hypothetical protein
VAEKDLNSAKVASRFVYDRSFRPPKRVRTVFLSRKADADYPFVNETGILSRAHVRHVIVTATEHEIIQGIATPLLPISLVATRQSERKQPK